MSLFGHPIHPMLVPLPIGAFVFSVLSLAVFVIGRDPSWLSGSYWLSIVGVVTGLAAAGPGFMDWLGIPSDARNKKIGAWHLGLNLTLVALFFISWLILGGPGGLNVNADLALALLVQITGALMLVGSGWLGGEMVYGKPAEESEQRQPEQVQPSSNEQAKTQGRSAA